MVLTFTKYKEINSFGIQNRLYFSIPLFFFDILQFTYFFSECEIVHAPLDWDLVTLLAADHS